ncbi:thioesterase family protein, partial [Enterobacter hormaechei]|nr:thioesterase family protein [Enterobacter hormaechei]
MPRQMSATLTAEETLKLVGE